MKKNLLVILIISLLVLPNLTVHAASLSKGDIINVPRGVNIRTSANYQASKVSISSTSSRNYIYLNSVKGKGCSDGNNIWYKVQMGRNANGSLKVGYVCSKYAKKGASTDKEISSCDDDSITDMVAVRRIDSNGTSKIAVKKTPNSNSKNLTSVEAGSMYKLLDTTEGYYKISIKGKTGYIPTSRVRKLTTDTTFVEVDLSSQTAKLYVGGQCKLKTNIVTGKYNSNQKAVNTRKGAYTIDSKTDQGHYFKDSKVYSNYWIPFDGGIGLHDADNWRTRYGFKASHGCVNLPLTAAKTIYDNIDYNSYIIVHS